MAGFFYGRGAGMRLALLNSGFPWLRLMFAFILRRLIQAMVAMTKAKPGTAEFRAALRDALENVKQLPAVNGDWKLPK